MSSARDRDAVLEAQQVLEQDLERVRQPGDVELRLQRVEPEDLVARGRRPRGWRGRRSCSWTWQSGSWRGRDQVWSAGSRTKGSPSLPVNGRKWSWSKVAMRLRVQPLGERDKRGVGHAERRDAQRDAQGLGERICPPSHKVGAALQVGPQRLAGADGAGEVVHLGHRERRRDEVVVERLEPAATRAWLRSSRSMSATTTLVSSTIGHLAEARLLEVSVDVTRDVGPAAGDHADRRRLDAPGAVGDAAQRAPDQLRLR